MTGNTAQPGGADSEREYFDHSAVLGLVADVGGTHIRFGIAVGGAEGAPVNVHCVRRYPVRTHAVHLVPCETGGQHVPPLSAVEITTRAATRDDANCVQAVGQFCGLLDSFAGDLAFALGAWHGVLISGAMLRLFDRPTLERRARAGFEDKGRFTPTMRNVPLETISHLHVELLGAARLLNS